MTESLYMLETKMASYSIREQTPAIDWKLNQVGVGNIWVSAITEAELQFGCLKHPKHTSLRELVDAFLVRVDRLAWDSEAAASYATIRTHGEKSGVNLSNLDMLIGAHAASVNATLITNDRAFTQFKKWITIDNWLK